MPHVDIGGRELHYVRRGTGEPLLLIHGLAGTHGVWGEPFLAGLDSTFASIAYDQRGAGHSGPADEPFTITDLADDAAALIAALGLERAHIFGTSMGGMVAQELAVRHPQIVTSLVLGCTYAGGPGSAITERAVITRYLDAMRSGDVELAVRTGFELNMAPAARERDRAYRGYRTLAFAAPVPRDVIFAQARATATHDTSARLGQVQAPTLIVHGDQDLMLDVVNAHHIAGLMPHARLEIMEGVGHVFWMEEPERSAALVVDAARSIRQR